MPNRECFVISPIGNEELDVVLDHIIRPAAKSAGIDSVIRADEIHSSGKITTDIVGHLQGADIVVAILTARNANVFYELAIRHILRKPFVHLIKEGEEIPFDLKDNRAVIYGIRVDQANKAAERLAGTITTELGKEPHQIEVPLALAQAKADLERIASKEPTSDLSRIAEVLSRLDERMSALSNRLDESLDNRSRPLMKGGLFNELSPSVLDEISHRVEHDIVSRATAEGVSAG